MPVVSLKPHLNVLFHAPKCDPVGNSIQTVLSFVYSNQFELASVEQKYGRAALSLSCEHIVLKQRFLFGLEQVSFTPVLVSDEILVSHWLLKAFNFFYVQVAWIPVGQQSLWHSNVFFEDLFTPYKVYLRFLHQVVGHFKKNQCKIISFKRFFLLIALLQFFSWVLNMLCFILISQVLVVGEKELDVFVRVSELLSWREQVMSTSQNNTRSNQSASAVNTTNQLLLFILLSIEACLYIPDYILRELRYVFYS